MEAGSPVAVFGGTGFLGHRIVRHLREHGSAVRIISRRPDRARTVFQGDDPLLEPVQADIRDPKSVESAIVGAHAVVNAVSLYSERGADTFQRLHVECAGLLASTAKRLGVSQLLNISGIGANPTSPSRYIRSRGLGEQAVRAAFPEAIIIRPAVMFAPDDAFVSRIVALLRRIPVYPLFGTGQTRLQPFHAEDVAEAVARLVSRTGSPLSTLECGGPHVYTYEKLLHSIARAAGLKPMLIPVPFSVWYAVARAAEVLSNPPIVRNQIELMQHDTVASSELSGLAEIGIMPESIEPVVQSIANAQR